MKANQAVLEKLKKILALANDAGATEGEVWAAMAKAKAIALEHNIELASISLEAGEQVKTEVTIDSTLKPRSKYEQPYHRHIRQVLAALFDVKWISMAYSSYGGKVVQAYHVVGDPTDIAMTVALFPYLESVYPKILSKFVRERILTYAAIHMNGCYQGITAGIIQANKREEEKLSTGDANKYALVVRSKKDAIDSKIKEAFPDMKTVNHRARQMSSYAAQLGQQEGSKINLRQINPAPRRQSIAG